jgi:hypothetical protein
MSSDFQPNKALTEFTEQMRADSANSIRATKRIVSLGAIAAVILGVFSDKKDAAKENMAPPRTAEAEETGLYTNVVSEVPAGSIPNREWVRAHEKSKQAKEAARTQAPN